MSTKQVIVARKDLNMRKGKLAAQVAHASMMFLTKRLEVMTGTGFEFQVKLNAAELDWVKGTFTKIVTSVGSQQELLDLIEKAEQVGLTVNAVIDAGKTEFGGVPTLTCAAFGPDLIEKVNEVTGSLPLNL